MRGVISIIGVMRTPVAIINIPFFCAGAPYSSLFKLRDFHRDLT